MTGRGSGRHASSAGGHELLDARALFREEACIQGLIYEQEVYQKSTKSTDSPLYLYLLREEGRRRVRVEVPREEAVDKLGL